MKKPAESLWKTVLILNTTKTESLAVGLITNGKIEKISLPMRAQQLQKIIVELLDAHNLTLNDVEAVGVLTGPGSYTGTRMGVTTANILGWIKKIPVFEAKGDNIDSALEKVLKSNPKVVTQARAHY